MQLNDQAIMVILTRVYYQLKAGLSSQLNDIFVVMCCALVNVVPEVFVRPGPLDVARMARSLADPERGSSTALPRVFSSWDLLSMRLHAEQLMELLERV